VLSTQALVAAAESFADLRRREFGRLDAGGHAYLDYTGSALYADSQLRAHQDLLQRGVFGNPHSEHVPSRASSEVISAARHDLLRFFDVDETTHDVCFTANTTAAIKLVAESYPFGRHRGFVLAADNHNSVNGVREYARRARARVRTLPLDGNLRLREPIEVLAEESRRGAGLLAFPAQSNFTGVRHPLSLVTEATNLGFDVLIDAAAFVPSSRLSLRETPAGFAALSFYKLFGYPTGLGALIARRDSLKRLQRPWFSGGTVVWASVQLHAHRLRAGHDGLEDGTPDFLGIAALRGGFALLESVGMTRLREHVETLSRTFIDGLASLRHSNGTPLAVIYGPGQAPDRGGTIAFNLIDRDGRVVPYGRVEIAARDAGVSFRGGCFCNPGASEMAFQMDRARLKRCLINPNGEFSPERLARCLGKSVGAVRASFGLANNESDIVRGLNVIRSFAE
jgi:selenocysteine lyase/cysteine desulfurase